MSFRYPKSKVFNAPNRMSTSGRTAAAYSLGKMGPGFGSISRIYNFCHNNTGDYNSAIQCVFGIEPSPSPNPNPPFETTFYFSEGLPETTTNTELTKESYNYALFEQLTSVIIGTSCTSIFGACFIGCINLTSVTIPNTVTSLRSDGGEEGCFQNCQALSSIIIPNSVTSIGDNFFTGCALTSIIIPNSVTSLGLSCFDFCTNLEYVELPINDYLTSLPDSFLTSTKISSITIPISVTSLGVQCFRNSSVLTYITIPISVTSLGAQCFQDCSVLTSIIIPSSVTFIERSCFRNCSELTFITLSSTITSIENELFDSCSKLSSVTIPISVKSLGYRCFNTCALTSITIPSSVTSIGSQCCRGCSALTQVIFDDPSKINVPITLMLHEIPDTTLITITFNNTADWNALNGNVTNYFVNPDVKPRNWTYNFFSNGP